MTPETLALSYLRQGWQPLPLPPRSKNPGDLLGKGWQNWRCTIEDVPKHFRNGCNIGCILGAASNNLVDIDLDMMTALIVGRFYLPQTAIFGRKSKQASHYLYYAKGKTVQRKSPVKVPVDGKWVQEMIVELRSTGGQTVFPGSVHPSGELISWVGEYCKPAVIDYAVLLGLVDRIAAASLLAKYWPGVGCRHYAAMYLGGGLLHAGWTQADTEKFVRAVCTAAGCGATDLHVATVADSARKFEAGENVAGWPNLLECIGEHADIVCTTARKWLGITELQSRSNGKSKSRLSELDDERAAIREADGIPADEAHWADGSPVEPKGDFSQQKEAKPRFAFQALGNLALAPEKRDWFVSIRGNGAKLLLMSKAFVIAADGDVGKSFLLLMLAVCAVLGIDLFDTFHFERSGHVALFMAEDDLLGCKHRLYRICNQLGLNAEQRQKLDECLHLCPLTGVEISLLAVDARGNAQRTEILAELVQFLQNEAKRGGFDWVFIGIDPLARFAGEAESSNAMSTAFVQGLEALIDAVPGKPALVSTHHSSKLSVRDGRVDIRGATGIRNAFRAAFTMLKVKAKSGTEGVLLVNDKHNDSVGADDLWLVRCKDEPDGQGGFIVTAGALRKASQSEADELDTALAIRRTGKEVVSENEYVTRVIASIEKNAGKLKSGRDVVKVTKGNASKVRDALKDALRDGLVTASEDGFLQVSETHL